MYEPVTDEIALVPLSAHSNNSEASTSTSVQVVVRKPEHSQSTKKKLIAKYRRTPFCFFLVLFSGIVLLSLILGCIVNETWRNGGHYDKFASPTVHSREDRAYHMEIVNSINSQNTTWKASYNSFASRQQESPMDMAEVSRLLHKKHSLEPNDLLQDTETHLKQLMRKKISLPRSFDVRKKYSSCATVHATHNQGGCGSCWAVAAASVMSDRLCISSNGSRQEHISAQDLTSCCSTCGGCQGTHWALSAFTFWKQHGLVTGGSYGSSEGCRPYEIPADCGSPCSSSSYTKSRTPTCKTTCNPLYSKNYREDIITSSSAYWLRAEKGSSEATPIVHKTIEQIVTGKYVELIKKELFLYGPILACFTLYEDFQHYHSGIYKSLSVPDPKELYGHCAKLIGWGVDGEVHYWTYMNTWGRDWGENGFFRIAISEVPEEAVAGLS